MLKHYRLVMAIALLVPGLLMLACVDAGSAESPLSVELNEWKVIPSVSSVTSGTAKVSVSNAGTLDHELIVMKTDGVAKSLPVKGNVVDVKAAGDTVGVHLVLKPANSSSASYKLSKGTYLLLCNLPGHYAQGMYSTLAVR